MFRSAVQAQVAVADLNNDGKLEMVASDSRGNLAAFDADGKEVWERHLQSHVHQVGATACSRAGVQRRGEVRRGRLAQAGAAQRGAAGNSSWLRREGCTGVAGGSVEGPSTIPRCNHHPVHPAQNAVFGDVDGDGQLEVVVATFRSASAQHLPSSRPASLLFCLGNG